MTREEGYSLVQNLIENENLRRHMYAVEAIMRSLAAHFGESVEDWGLAGLIHDADYELTKDDPAKHTIVLKEKIDEAGLEISEEVMHAVYAHNHTRTGVEPASLFDWALICADDVSGLITACALVQPEKKLATVKLKSVKKKFKNPSFAAGVDREGIKLCEEKLDMALDEFLQLALEALQGSAETLGL